MTRHRVAVCLMLLWALMFYKTVQAATVAEFMGAYDSLLLQWSAATALLGSTIRTILSLETDDRPWRLIVKCALWDAIKALAAGLLVFIIVQAIRSTGMAVPSEIRFLAVLAAGWGRAEAINWAIGAGLEWANARKKQFVNKPADEQTPKGKE